MESWPGHGESAPSGALYPSASPAPVGGVEVPEPVRALLAEHVTSYEELVSLLLLMEEADSAVTARSVSERLGIGVPLVDEALTGLCQGELVHKRTAAGAAEYQYAPGNPALRDAVELLAQEYRRNLTGIVRLITANAIERMHSQAARMFAEAFVVRRNRNYDDS